MKSELAKTGLFVMAAILLVSAATWIEPGAATPEVLSDEGEALFPEFRNIEDVKAVEVIAYDEDQAVVTPLKVEFRKNRWLLPSHNDYPADAGDRLDKTTAALLDVKKDMVVSDSMESHAEYGVIDPLDTKVAGLTGRGKRVTLRDEAGEALADVILGKAVPDHEGYRYARLPGQKRVYGVQTEADPSARFEDWVEDNLLGLASSRIRKITVNSYSIDESVGRLRNVQRLIATKEDGKWKVDGSGKASAGTAAAAARALTAMHVNGARPKPKELAGQLRDGQLQMTLETVMSLRQRGFFLTPAGQLLANEGEVIVDTDRGIVYTLRFGEIVAESGLAGDGGGEGSEEGEGGTGAGKQNRYIFVTASYDQALQEKYGGSSGERTANFLNRKFADWYYIISGDDFDKIRMRP